MEKETDTIVSQATAAGVGAVGIVRISGIEAKKVLEDLYIGISGEVVGCLRSRYMYHGKIISMREGNVLDEVLVVYMGGPKSFTGEDVVEIHCHGGELVPNKIMEEILNLGYVRLANRGEFTRRAYLNGKVDLLQAEAIDEIIKARNGKLLESAQGLLKKELSDKIKGYRRVLLDVLSGIEAYIDYPEEELEGPFGTKIKKLLSEIIYDIEKVLKDSKEGERLRSGVRVVLVGKPNVGKSSLFNYLLRKSRSIVSSSPGTTRDYIDARVMLGGELEVELVDTAGVREDAEDVIEGEGIKFSYAKMGETDYVLWLLDSSESYSKDDDVIKQELERLGVGKENVILVKNKIDLVKGGMDDGILKGFNTFSVSVLEGYGLKEFELGLKDLILGGKEGVEQNRSKIYCNIRQSSLLRVCCAGIKEVEKLLSNGAGYEFISLELMGALSSLDELVGEHTTSDRVIDNIFDKFCVGK